MQHEFTPAAVRALAEAERWTGSADSDELAPPELLLGLLAEAECRAAAMLARHRVDATAVRRRWQNLAPRAARDDDRPLHFSDELHAALAAVETRLVDHPRPLFLATEHLLLGLAGAGGEVARWLTEQGLDHRQLEAEIHELAGLRPGPLEVAFDDQTPGQAPATSPTGESAQLRILDAAANRAREGLRVVEDHARFVLEDAHLSAQLKSLRHDLAAVLSRFSPAELLAARDTLGDVGVDLSTPSERRRATTDDVAAANFHRLAESLRSLEEFAKLTDRDAAARLEQLRYRSYTLQRALFITQSSGQRLAETRLYVLIDGAASLDDFETRARVLVEAGVHALQLRDKRLADAELLARARRLRQLTRGTAVLFIMNDRPDLARLAEADGVHVGQEELSVKDARAIVGPRALIGVSTHSLDQARRGVLDGADYLGVGPTFPSSTKEFAAYPGLDLLRAAASEIRLPAFAIGGVSLDNIDQVLAAGFTRAAVSSAIWRSDDPARAARAFLESLESSL